MGVTYEQSGVNIDAGNQLIQRLREPLKATMRPEILNNVGGFAALATLPSRYREPVLVCGTDGVGTKLELAIQHDFHERIGQDLVAMCVNDLLVYGAEPFLFLDYYATGKLDVDIASRVIEGIAQACKVAGCSLVGGETAELPGLYGPKIYDVAGFCLGVVEKSDLERRQQIKQGDLLLGLASDGPHSNGYSLIRKLLNETRNQPPNNVWEQITSPTRIYTNAVLPVAPQTSGMAHITGGGLIENPPRMLREGLAIELDLKSWNRPECFAWIDQVGQMEPFEMLRTFNCGIGYILAVPEESVKKVMKELEKTAETVSMIGRVVRASAKSTTDTIVIQRDCSTT